MPKKVLILEGSARKNGNTDLLSNEFINGAESVGLQTEKVYLHDKEIKCCIGCRRCQSNGGNCIRKDDATAILQKMLDADFIVLASPVYFYSFTGLLKMLLDRSFSIEKRMTDKTFYLITSGGAPEHKYYETIETCYLNYIGCFEKAINGGIIHAYGMAQKGDVKGSPIMLDAYNMGRSISLN